MNILQLCNKVPFPPKDGGAIAIMNMSQILAKNNNNVTVLAMNTSKHNTDQQTIPGKYSSNINHIYIPVNTEVRALPLLMNLLFSSSPYNAKRFISKTYSSKLTALLSNEKFGIVQLEGLYMTPYIELIRMHSQAKIVYRPHNLENEIWNRIAFTSNHPLKKYYLHNLAKRIRKFEQKAINRYDLLVPISERDSRQFQSMGNKKASIVSSAGILSGHFKKTVRKGVINKLCYIGALDWIPNQEGLVWFLDHVWHTLRKVNPALEFHVAGRNAPDWLVRKCLSSHIIYHGEIEDSLSFFDRHDILVVPLFAGSGVRIKIAEAMARSKVIITTPVGAEGLGISNKKQAIIAENKSDFLREIKFLLKNPDFFAQLEKNAYEHAKKNFDNDIISEILLKFYKQNI